jgi:hypothetical protein
MTTSRKPKVQRSVVTTFWDNYGILAVYMIALLALIYSTVHNAHWFMLIPIAIFLIHDIWFRWCRKSSWVSSGRDHNGTVESIRAASQYTSFFIAFIAISLSLTVENTIFLLGDIKVTGDDNLTNEIKNLFASPLVQYYGFTILAFSALVLLFIPISYLDTKKKNWKKKKKNREPSIALKNCFFAVLFMEKTIILLLVYLIIQIFKLFIK